MIRSPELDALSIAVQVRMPVLLWGEPGIGKSSVIEQLAQDLELPLEVVIAAIREPSDFSGLPFIENGTSANAPPSWAKRLAEKESSMLFLDEISCAPPAVQAALLRVVLERVVGDLELPEGVAIVAAANPADQAAGGWDLSAPMANRFCHLPWPVSAEAWCYGMIAGFKTNASQELPVGWRDSFLPKACARVVAYIKTRPDKLLVMPDDLSSRGKAWPSPRMWTKLAELMAACDALKASESCRKLLATGCIGKGAADEYFHWLSRQNLPDPEEVLQSPASWSVPAEGDVVYAVLCSVIAVVLANNTAERWQSAWRVLVHVADTHRKDIAVTAAMQLAKDKPEGARAPTEASIFGEVLRRAVGRRRRRPDARKSLLGRQALVGAKHA